MELKEILQFGAFIVALLGLICLPFILFILNSMKEAVSTLSKSITDLANKISTLELKMAEKYVTKAECDKKGCGE